MFHSKRIHCNFNYLNKFGVKSKQKASQIKYSQVDEITLGSDSALRFWMTNSLRYSGGFRSAGS